MVKEQHAPEVHREVALLSTDNEFNREITEEDTDFNIPGLPHSTVKQLHGASIRELIQKIENHPHRHALQRDLQQCQSFNPFSQESKQMIHEVGNIELCELLVQSLLIILGRRHRLLHVRALLAKRNRGEQEICPVHHRFPLDSQLLHKERATPRAPLREEARGSRSRIRSRRNARRTSRVSTTGSSATRSSAKTCLTSVEMKKYVVRWTKVANEDHTHHITPEELRVYKNSWCEYSWFRYDASSASK